tara:strand:- start:872 stop:1240 length:369 start_codon:yes stop_codon:yes gene_type:complete
MVVIDELTENNLILFAAQNYRKPNFSDIEEFYEDLKRFKYVKRLINRYLDHDELAERLILNHIIVICNSFTIPSAMKMLELKLDNKHWPVIKPFLVYLKYIKNDQYTGITMDPNVVDKLRKI